MPKAASVARWARFAGPVVAGLMIATSASAQLHIDVSFQEDQDGRLGIHGRDFNQLPLFRMVPDQRVFGRSFLLSGNALVQNDPGFTASDNPVETDPVNLFPPISNTNVHFNLIPASPNDLGLGQRNLSYWDGNGSVSWGPVPGGEGIEVSSFSNSATADGSSSTVPGFVIDATDNEGGMHRHIDFRLTPDSGADGVYLMTLEGTLDPYAEWIPFYLVYEGFAGGQASLDAAITHVETNIVDPLCSDGIDNDRDGNVDFPADAGCADAMDMSERGATAECDNGIDDDMDGTVDYPNDPTCTSPTDAIEVPEPSVWIGLLSGAGLVGWLRRRRLASRSARGA